VPRVESLHIAKATRLPMRAVDSVEVEAGRGIVGDRYHGTKHRHVTVQSAEALAEATRLFGSEVPAQLTRRNITLADGVVPRDPGERVRIGDVLLEVVRVAAPCKLLDDTIGRGAQEALRRRGGSVFRVLEGGVVSVGDEAVLDLP
jgi:MOSC domain-containing protein YiiM